MSRRQRSRLIIAAAFLTLIATVLNIGRTDGWLEAMKVTGLLVGIFALLILILAWERRGKP